MPTPPAGSRRKGPAKKRRGAGGRKSSSEFYYSRTFKGFRVNGVSRKGVCKTVQTEFCRGVDYTLLQTVLARMGRLKERPIQQTIPRTSKQAGVDLGTRVHNEFKYLYGVKTTDGSRFNAPKRKLHPFTQAVIDMIHKRGWIIVQAEAPVYRQGEGRCATCVDILCKDQPFGRAIILELKTGSHRANYFTPIGHMTGAFAADLISEASMHQLQLFATTILFQSKFPTAKLGGAYVMHVTHADGCQVYPLTEWKAQHVAAMRKVLL